MALFIHRARKFSRDTTTTVTNQIKTPIMDISLFSHELAVSGHTMPVIMLSVEIHFCLANILLKISGQPRKNYSEKVSEVQKPRSYSMFPYPSQMNIITVTGEFKATSSMKSSIYE